MSTRVLALSGTADKTALAIKPADVYVSLTGAYEDLKYIGTTTEEVTISTPREYAELRQDNVRYAIDEKSKDFSFGFAFHEVYNPDLLAIAMGESSVDTSDPLVDRVVINSESATLPEYMWAVRTETRDGRDVEAVIWTGQVLNPEDFMVGISSGNTEYGSIGITVEAVQYANSGNNELGYIDITKPV